MEKKWQEATRRLTENDNGEQVGCRGIDREIITFHQVSSVPGLPGQLSSKLTYRWARKGSRPSQLANKESQEHGEEDEVGCDLDPDDGLSTLRVADSPEYPK